MYKHETRFSATYWVGLSLLTQKYRAALSNLYSDQSFTLETRLRQVDRLRKEHEQWRAQEIEAMKAQMRVDAEVS